MGETRSVKQSIPGKQRNYVLDFMKVVAAFTVVFVHTTQNIFPSEVQVSGASGLFNYWSVTSDVGFWPRGFYTLGFYTFTTFYWMMNSYQKLKRQGVIHKGYDGELIYRYCAKNYISYWPALLICSLSGFVAFCMFSGGTVSQFIVAFLKGIPQFLGIDGFIQGHNDALFSTISGVMPDITSAPILTFQPAAWYLSALIAMAFIFFALLIIHEKFTVFVLSPILLIYEILSFISVAPSSFLGLPFQQLSMGVVGFWIWYAVDALKAGEVSPVVRKFLGWAKLILVALHLSHFIFGWSNRLGEGIMWAFSLIITLANIDWFTNFFNRIFSKMKTAKYWGDWALGLFLFHYPMFPLCKYVLVPRFGWFAGAWMCVGLVCVAAAAFIPFYHKITKPISAFLTKLFLLDRPVGEMLKKEKKAN